MMKTIIENVEPAGIWNAVVRKASILDCVFKRGMGKIVSENTYENLIPTVGRTAMAVQHAGNAAVQQKLTHIAVGSDNTAPLNSDTILGAEVARKALGSKTNVGVETSVAVFFAASEATGTHLEFGAFGNGNTTTSSITSDSGIMYSHVAANVAVAASETLTLTYKTTFN